jgi:hypothetical protein
VSAAWRGLDRGGRFRPDGRPLDDDNWLLFGRPFLEAAVDSQRLTMKHGALRRTFDFRGLTITE